MPGRTTIDVEMRKAHIGRQGRPALGACFVLAAFRQELIELQQRSAPCYTFVYLTGGSMRNMKTLLAICMFVSATLAWAGENPAPAAPEAAVVSGEVLEVKEVAGYTYLRLKTSGGETWAAVVKALVKKGDTVAIENPMVMNNFTSKALNKTFPTILFGSLGGAGGSAGGAAAGAHVMGTAYATLPKATATAGNVHVAKATGANARTVAEVMTGGAQLKDKTVIVRGKVVKYNPGIMGKNWVHLRDGSGSAADESNDLLVTTMSETRVGAVVTAKGIVRTDKDFGAGYAYKTLVEEATLQ